MTQPRRSARTREALLRAAAEVFAEEGFVSATISSISKKAGVSNGALHFHFENKRALGRAVEAEFVDTVQRITREAGERPGNPLQRLIDAMYMLMSRIDDDVVVRAGFQLVGPASRRRETTEHQGEWYGWIDEVLRAAEREGALADGVSSEQALTTVVVASVGFAVLGIRDPRWISRPVLSQFWELLLPRLAPPDKLPELVPQGTNPGATEPSS